MTAVHPATGMNPVTTVQLTLIGKPDCHLCDVAQGVIDEVLGELDDVIDVTIEKRSILDDSELYDKYWEKIPVLLIDGDEHAHWRIDAVKLRSALKGTQ